MTAAATFSPTRCALLVDDDPAWARLATEAFRRAAPEVAVHSADNVVSALDHMVGGDLPDLVVLDLHMPGLGGLDFLRTLREARLERTRLVLMSSLLTDVDRSAALTLGACECREKPKSFPDLVELVSELVAGTAP